MPLKSLIRGAFRRDVLLLCLVIFCCDTIWSLQSPTFSIYSRSLGASLTFIGFLGSVTGLTQFLFSVPIGLQSDRFGRKPVIIMGLFGFCVAMIVFGTAANPYVLVPGRVLFGAATTATFTIGAAYVGDVIKPEERGIVFGMYATSMGGGATVGPLVGAAVEPYIGVSGSYLVGAGLALFGAALAAWGLIDTRHKHEGEVREHVSPGLGSMLAILRNPNMLAACLATLLANVSFIGMISTLFPIYASNLGASQPKISSMYSGRAFTSMLTRLPAGIVAGRTSRWLFMVGALTMMALVVIGMGSTANLALLAVLLILEGVAFGSFLTVGQAFVAEHSSREMRGAAVGAYSTAGSISSTLSPLVLGAIADGWGIATAFAVTAGFLALGMLLMGFLYARSRSMPSLATEKV